MPSAGLGGSAHAAQRRAGARPPPDQREDSGECCAPVIVGVLFTTLYVSQRFLTASGENAPHSRHRWEQTKESAPGRQAHGAEGAGQLGARLTAHRSPAPAGPRVRPAPVSHSAWLSPATRAGSGKPRHRPKSLPESERSLRERPVKSRWEGPENKR